MAVSEETKMKMSLSAKKRIKLKPWTNQGGWNKGIELDPIKRFMSWVQKDSSGCWLWGGALEKTGYGASWYKGKKISSHRLAYILFKGNLPRGHIKTIDHLCRNPRCCNPDHLELVEHKVNVMRGVGLSKQNALKTHCKRGHRFTDSNTYLTKAGSRSCKKCMALHQREYRKRISK